MAIWRKASDPGDPDGGVEGGWGSIQRGFAQREKKHLTEFGEIGDLLHAVTPPLKAGPIMAFVSFKK